MMCPGFSELASKVKAAPSDMRAQLETPPCSKAPGTVSGEGQRSCAPFMAQRACRTKEGQADASGADSLRNMETLDERSVPATNLLLFSFILFLLRPTFLVSVLWVACLSA